MPYHLLRRESTYGDNAEATENLIVQGDNLLALKALLPFYAGQVKCIFIDPPYNTKSAFEHYDDNLEHSQWLSMIYPRLVLLRELLAEDGSIWVSIDDNEAHYLKVVMDEVFGRSNFVTTVVWKRRQAPETMRSFFFADQDYILVYAKNPTQFLLNRLERTESSNKAYKNSDNDPRGPWREIDYKCAKTADERPDLYYPITHPVTGEEVWPRRSRVPISLDRRRARVMLADLGRWLVPRRSWPGYSNRSPHSKKPAMRRAHYSSWRHWYI